MSTSRAPGQPPFTFCLYISLWFWMLLPRAVLAWRAPDPVLDDAAAS